MPVFPRLERLVRFHHQKKTGRRPNAACLAERFENSTIPAQREIACLLMARHLLDYTAGGFNEKGGL